MSTKGMLVLCPFPGTDLARPRLGLGPGPQVKVLVPGKTAFPSKGSSHQSQGSCVWGILYSPANIVWLSFLLTMGFPLANNIEDAVLLNELSGHKSSASARPSDPSYQSSVFKDPGSSSSAPWHSGPLFLWVWVTYKNEMKMCVIFSCQAYTMSTQTLKGQRRGIHSPKCVGWVRN